MTIGLRRFDEPQGPVTRRLKQGAGLGIHRAGLSNPSALLDFIHHTVDGKATSISHRVGNHGEPLFMGIYRGFIIPGFLWCEMDFVHPQHRLICATCTGTG